MASKLYGDFNEAGKPKSSLAKYSIEFNDFAVQTRPYRIPYLRLLGIPYTHRNLTHINYTHRKTYTKIVDEVIFHIETGEAYNDKL